MLSLIRYMLDRSLKYIERNTSISPIPLKPKKKTHNHGGTGKQVLHRREAIADGGAPRELQGAVGNEMETSSTYLLAPLLTYIPLISSPPKLKMWL